MRIVTGRLTLVPMSMEYLDSAHGYSADPENTRFLTFPPNDSIEETEGFIRLAEQQWEKEQPLFYEFAVLLGEEHIGAVSLYPKEGGAAEIGWIIGRRWQGQGFGYEAARAVLDYAHGTLGFTQFKAVCDPENIASRRVMEKLGMRCAGEHGGCEYVLEL